MYDELVKRLRYCSEEHSGCGVCELSDNCVLRAGILLQAADAIEELSRNLDSMNDANIALYGALPRWIPVTERLPGSGVPSLICGDGNVVEQGFFDDEYGYWYDWGGNRTFVHHWMPLPEPPKEA